MHNQKIKFILGFCFIFIAIAHIVRYFFYGEELTSFILGLLANLGLAVSMFFFNKEKGS